MTEAQNRRYAIIMGISVIVITVFAVIFVARLAIGGPEDDWICVKGEWVMHGKPISPKPTTPCIK